MAGSGTAQLRTTGAMVLAVEQPRRRVPGRRGGAGPRRVRRQLRHRRGRDAGAGRRVRLRQVDDRPRRSPSSPPPTSGSVVLDGTELVGCSTTDACGPLRPRFQMIFQDPVVVAQPTPRGPRHRRRAAARCGASTSQARWRRQVHEILDAVGLDADERRQPAARASSPVVRRSASASPGRSCSRPRLLVCDEPVSSLDVSVQAQIINLLASMQGALRPDDAVHRPRPGRGQERQRPAGRDVPRQAVRDRRRRRRLRPRRPIRTPRR